MKKSRICKKLLKIFQNSKNVDFNILKGILNEFGYIGKPPSGGGSHFIFRKSRNRKNISVPFKKPVGEIYVKQVIELLDLEEWYEANC